MKTIRRSYSIPQIEQEHLDALPNKFTSIKPKLNKSEVIRLGVKLFDQTNLTDVKRILTESLDRLKVGRPKKLPIVKQTGGIDAELTINDKQWNQITKIIQQPKIGPGKPKQDDHQVLNGILYIFRFDKQRRDVPKNYSSFSTCRRRLGEWRKESLWQQICYALIKNAPSASEKKELSEVLLRTWIIEIK